MIAAFMRLRALIPTILALSLLAMPAAALAQDSPLAPLDPAQTVQDVTVAPPVSTGSSGGLSSWQEALIFVAAILLIVGIAWLILADSRARTPRGPEREDWSRTTVAGSKRPHNAVVKQRKRAKDKHARRQRKANR